MELERKDLTTSPNMQSVPSMTDINTVQLATSPNLITNDSAVHEFVGDNPITEELTVSRPTHIDEDKVI